MHASRLIALTLLALPALAHAEPLAIDVEHLGPRWLGVQSRDNLGWRVQAPGDLNGDGRDDFLASSPQDQGPATSDSILRVFFGQTPPPSGDADWSGVEIADPKLDGDSVSEFAVVGDLTGDGVRDLLVPEPSAGEFGRVLLYPGSPTFWPSTMSPQDAAARWDGFDEVAPPEPGMTTASRPSHVGAGDFNGDGQLDVVIGSALNRSVWIDLADGPFEGDLRLQQADLTFRQCEAGLVDSGFAVDLAIGDWNDDARADLAVSAPGCEGGEGRVFVWYGGAMNPATPDLSLGGGDRLGGELNVGDLNGDGVDDLFAQETRSAPVADRSNLWVWFGGGGGLAATPDVTIDSGPTDLRFGESVAMLADISSVPDGRRELVVGSPETAGDRLGQGAVYIFEGREDWAGSWTVEDAWYEIVGTSDSQGPKSEDGAWFGASLAALDDFDGDGYPEVVISEPNYTDGEAENDYQRGRLYLLNALPDRDEDDDGMGTLAGDCDDTDPDVRPGVAEVCDDGIDNDCDHEVNEGCGDDDDDVGEDDDDDSLYIGDDDDDVGDDDDDSLYIGDDDDAGGCDCESSLASGGGAGGLGLLLLAAGYRRRWIA